MNENEKLQSYLKGQSASKVSRFAYILSEVTNTTKERSCPSESGRVGYLIFLKTDLHRTTQMTHVHIVRGQ